MKNKLVEHKKLYSCKWNGYAGSEKLEMGKLISFEKRNT
jgi:hypothetical protein